MKGVDKLLDATYHDFIDCRMKMPNLSFGFIGFVQERSNFQIIPMADRHVQAVALIHDRELPTSILSRLGFPFLKDFYYRGLLSVKGFKGFVILWEDRVAGFITLSLDPANIFMNLIKSHFGTLVLSLVRSLLKDIRVLRAILQATRYMLSNDGPVDPGHSEILSFAVPEEFRTREFYQTSRLKLGNELFRFALDFLKKSGKERTFLMVETQNAPARIFYKNMGMQETGLRTYFGLECLKIELYF